MPFRDVIGHGATIADLRAALVRDSLPHALLFVGRTGIGKRTVARALLAARYCEKPKDGDACGRCPECARLAREDHTDVLLLERERGKRDIGIAAIRDVQAALHLSATSGRGRSVVVDGAERMTEEAQNAFLKTLEEPPAKAVVILVSSAVDRLLPTIRSRCAAHRFAPLSEQEMGIFVSRSGSASKSLPLSLARGSPGSWLEVSKSPHPAARSVVLDLLLHPDVSPFDLAARLQELAMTEEDETLEDAVTDASNAEEEVSDTTEIGRRRLEQWLLLLEWAVRDVLVLAARGAGDLAPPAVRLVHSDREDDLRRLGTGFPVSAWFPMLDSIERARFDLHRNIDRALTLETLAVELRRRLGYGKSSRSALPAR